VNEFDVIIALCTGLGLAAASGFRVFLPPFLLSIAVRADAVNVNLMDTPFEYFDSNVAVILLGVATVAEFAAYYVPWVDNLLDTIASPAAIIAGAGMTAIVLEGTDPVIQWSLAIIAGGGVTAAVQGATVITRGVSTAVTAGIGNPVVSTGENIASLILSILAIVLAPLAAVLVVILLAMIVKRFANKAKPSSA
jgi:hypothetical protein